jgi:hypothetical protein
MFFLVIEEDVGSKSFKNRRLFSAPNEMCFVCRRPPRTQRADDTLVSRSIPSRHQGDANPADVAVI